MGVAASLPRHVTRPWARVSALAQLGAAPLVAGMVVASALLRGFAGMLKETPAYFPDEYRHAELARSLAESGEPLVRGNAIGFPALLQPLVTAPVWLLDDVGTSYALVKWIGALTVSLAAVPAYLLARRLGLRKGLALGAAALSLATPSLFYASWVMGEPFAYPLVLCAVYAATVALGDRSRRAGIAFVACAALAAFSRAQFTVLPACFLAALLVVGLRRRSLRADLRAQAIPLTLFAGPVLLLLAMPGRVVGPYGAFLEVGLDPVRLAERFGTNAIGLAYASGWILVPGALLGIALAVARPRSQTELAFGAIALSVMVAVLLQASAYGDVDRVQERYTFYGAPLIALALGLFASRGWPARRAHALLAAGALAAAAGVPLAFHAADAAKSQSAFLFAVHRLEELLGSDGSGALAVGAVAAALSVAAGLLALRPRIATSVVPAVAVCFAVAASVLAVDFDRRNTSGVRDVFLPPDPSWIDRAAVGDVALVRGLGLKTDAMEQLFWNRAVDRVVLLPGAEPFDVFGAESLSFAPDGTLVADRRPVRSALLIDTWATRIELRGATAVGSSSGFRLWRADGIPRLALYAPGYYRDGWIALRTGLNVWAAPGRRLSGRLSFVVSAPNELPAPVRLRVVGGGRQVLALRLQPGESRRVRIAACGERGWFGAVLADRGIVLGDRSVSVRATPPRFRADPAACR